MTESCSLSRSIRPIPLGTPSRLAPPNADGHDGVLEATRPRGASSFSPESGSRSRSAARRLAVRQIARRRPEFPLHGGNGDIEGTGQHRLIPASSRSPAASSPPIWSTGGRAGRRGDLTERPPPAAATRSPSGSSFAFDAEPLPRKGPVAEAMLTYGEYGRPPASPHFADQTVLFSEKRWRPVLFTEDQIASDPELEVRMVSGARRSLTSTPRPPPGT